MLHAQGDEIWMIDAQLGRDAVDLAFFGGRNGLVGGGHREQTPHQRKLLVVIGRCWWFALLSQKQIKRGTHRSVRALETATREYLAITNEAPTPFVWTKTADEILAKVAGFCQRISNPGH